MKRLVYGVGINDANYVIEKREYHFLNGKKIARLVWRCPYYTVWSSMLRRCYSKKYSEVKPTYENVSCCEEWLIFSTFKSWMEQQDWEGRQLDKDLLVFGNTIYSPTTCVFITKKLNSFLAASTRPEVGASYCNKTGGFRAMCSNPLTGESECLGRYKTKEAAHNAWKLRKHEISVLLAEQESDLRIKDALLTRFAG